MNLWLNAQDTDTAAQYEAELRDMQHELLQHQVPFHWMLEFPEVFYYERPDPLEGGKVNGAAFVEAFVGNPPFAGKNGISEAGGTAYSRTTWWHGSSDPSARSWTSCLVVSSPHKIRVVRPRVT